MLEVEYKSLLTKEIFDKIRTHYKWDHIKSQTNHYYTDPTGELSRRHIMVRVREIDGKYCVQVKAHKNPGEALQICEENEFPIDALPEAISKEDAFKYTGVRTGDLALLGDLTTLRHSLMWCQGVEICLDKSEYFDRVDYEIEVEYTGDFPPQLMDELRDLGVEFKEKSKGKYTRFVKRLMEIMKNEV